MPVRKLTHDQWAYEIKRAESVRGIQREKIKSAKFVYFDKVIGKFMPLPYIIGIGAAALLFFLYGPKEFFKFFLSWCVSVTLVATGAYYVWKYYEKQI